MAGDVCPLDKPIQFLRGVGPYRAKILAELGVSTVGDMIEYYPFRHEYQGPPQPIDSLELDAPATVVGMLDSLRWKPGWGRSKPALHGQLSDSTGKARVTWFNASFLRERLARGQLLRIHGQVSEYEGLAQFVNPRLEWVESEDDPELWTSTRIEPVYRSTAKLGSQQIAKLVKLALAEALPHVAEPLPQSVIEHNELISRQDAIRQMHEPATRQDWLEARRRLAFEELFLMQVAILLQRQWTVDCARAPKLSNSARIDGRIRKRFPFALTEAQNKVVENIVGDLEQHRPMTRLLQGDVGSGKTVVALYAALVSIANRYQCAILAPTEVLASQHHAGVERYLEGSRVRRCLLTGRTQARERERLLRAIAAGQMDLVVGTQALLEKKVAFGNLGLVIVDEQHKFGVGQRAALRSKTQERDRLTRLPHYLVMTATPIPRTLSMTVFGDLDVSTIDQLPPGRQPIETKIVGPDQEAEAWLTVRERLARGEQAYVVYPLVEESDALDLKAATEEVHRVRDEYLPGCQVSLLHGRMKNTDKQAVMDRFKQGKLDALVSTTVIEVGVDVPNATVMVIQHAERYGLAALHQLRGRVGRGEKASLCLLMSDSQQELAQRRLGILAETTNGFRIAEEDLRIRGPGELMGTRQHGWPEFRVADLAADMELLKRAREEADVLVAEDTRLRDPRLRPLRVALRRRFRDKVAFIDVG